MTALLFAVHSGVPISLKTVMVIAQYIDLMIWWVTTPGLKTLLPETIWIRRWESESEGAGRTHVLLIAQSVGGADVGDGVVWVFDVVLRRGGSLNCVEMVTSGKTSEL